MPEGRKSSRTISTARIPVRYAICPRSRYAAGIAAQPVNDSPKASAIAFIVEAVPIVLQCPIDGAEAIAACKNCSRSISPAAYLCRACQITMPDPTSALPSCPSSIGPPDSTMAGISTVDAAMIAAGVVLSQPVVSTTPSSG